MTVPPSSTTISWTGAPGPPTAVTAGVITYVGIGDVHVTFPAGLFTAPPTVVLTLQSWSGTIPDYMAAHDADATQVWITAGQKAGGSQPSCQIGWVAVQP